MKHNYNESMVKYYKTRVDAMTKHIRKLEDRIAFLEAEKEVYNRAYYE